MDDLHPRRRFGVLALSLTFTLVAAACSGAAAPTAPPTDAPGTPPPSSAPPTDVPPGDPLGWGGRGGDVAPDGAKIVEPRPGQLDVREVQAESIVAKLDGRRLTVAVTWWSGVEPCTILDSVVVATEADGYAITLREGRGPEDVACIAIAEQHRIFIEFPDELVPGTYTIRDGTGGAPAIEVVVG